MVEGNNGRFAGQITVEVIFAMVKQKRLTVNRLHIVLEEIEMGAIKSSSELVERIRDEIQPAQ